jgi:fibronectin-binding autotransporter adhesin
MNRRLRTFLRKATAITVAITLLSQTVWADTISFIGNANPSVGQSGVFAYWNFNGLSIVTASAPGTGGVPTTMPADFEGNGSATLSLTGWTGLVDDFGGSTGNAQLGDSAGASLSPVGSAGNGSYLEFSFSMAGLENLTIDFSRRGTSTGFSSGLWSYSTDGTTFTQFGSNTASTSTSFTPAPQQTTSALNGASTAYLRYTLSGASSTSGNNRIDNLTFSATMAATGGGGGTTYYWVGSDAARGGDGTWVGSGGTAWATADADQAGGAWDATKTASFAGVTAGTVTVSGTVDADAGINFSTDGYTLAGGTLSLGGANAAANTIATDTATAIAIASVITGSTGLTKSGDGTLTLSGTNTYSGGTTVSAGTLSVSSDANLGGTSGGITLGGGTLEMTSSFTLDAGRTITAAASTTSTIAVTSGTVSFAGPFTGSGGLDKAGAGTLSVSNASSEYTGTFTISAGTLEVTGANAFASATLTQNGGSLIVAPAGGGDVVLPEIGGDGGTVSIDSGANAVFSGSSNRSYNGQINGQGGLKKQGSGELTLNGNNGFTGATRIEGGRLTLGAGGSLSGTPEILVDNGAIFDLTSKNDGLALGNGQRLGGRGTVLGDLEFGSGSQLAFDPSGPMLVGSGTISFAEGFGIGSILGLDSSTPENTYTLLDETSGGSISFANLANVGPGSPFDLGGGKSAYFQQGSLQVVVVPEPDAFLLGGLGLALVGLVLGRRRTSSEAQAA